MSSPVSAWYVAGIRGEDLQLTLIEPQAGLSIRKLKDSAGSGWNVEARGLDIGHLFDVRREGSPLLDGGIADGRVNFQTSADALRFHVDIGARGARFGTLADNDDGEPQLGDATDVTLRFDGVLQRAEGAIEIPEVHGTLAGADLSGSMTLRDMDTDPSVDLALGVRQLDFGRLLGAAGLAVPESLGIAPGGSRDLGSASIEVGVRGSLSAPATLAVSQKINFSPPGKMPPAISRLRRDFVFRSDDGLGPAPPHRCLALIPRLHRPARRSAAVRAHPAAFRRRGLLRAQRHRPSRTTLRAAHQLVARGRGTRRVDNYPAVGQEPVPVA